MPEDLNVPEGQTYRFDAEVDPALEPYLQTVAVDTLSDLVRHELVRSNDVLDSMLDAAKGVTTSSLGAIHRTSDVRLVRGTRRVDLGRFRPFAVRATAGSPAEREVFWRIFRSIPGNVAVTLDRDSPLRAHVAPAQLLATLVWAKDVTVQQGATLLFAGPADTLKCRHLLIKKTGRIEVEGSGLLIQASSIKGEQ